MVPHNSVETDCIICILWICLLVKQCIQTSGQIFIRKYVPNMHAKMSEMSLSVHAHISLTSFVITAKFLKHNFIFVLLDLDNEFLKTKNLL